jgi:DegV family protein with EDD domain
LEDRKLAKIAVITDTNSGMSNEEAAKLGVIIVPMPFNISGTEYFEGISLTQDQFYEKLVGGDDISTSQPTPGSVMEIWDKALEDHDEVVYIPMSSGLSSSCQTALMLA